MKKINFKLILTAVFIVIINSFGFAQTCSGNQTTESIENVTITATTIEYDVYISNTGSTNMLLAALQGSIVYDDNLLASGATLTMSIVTQPTDTGNFPTLSQIQYTNITSESRQLRWAHTPVSLASGNTVNLPSNTQMFFARFRITSSMPWMPGTHSLGFAVITDGSPTTTNLATVYCNGNTSSTPVTSALGGMVYVNRTFIVTPEMLLNTTDQQNNESILLASPNPFNDHFNLSLQTISNEVVTVKVYDLTGKLVESKTINPIDITRCEMGSKYASGVYNVVVSQGELEENHKMIKR
ncbi:MAG: T9SS type A sorting domain-containing protein [Flavobacterium sp.]|nr:T9SS type A sorting domain-containing protein [Flavobacterium sp.]